MHCPNCKDKKGRAIQVDPVSRACQKCGRVVYVSHRGKLKVIGAKAAAPAPTSPSSAAPAAVKK